MIQSSETRTGDTTTPPGEAKVTGRSQTGGRRVQRTVNFDRETLERARAAATYLARNEPAAGVRSLADIVNPAVADAVAELERRFNGGTPFQPVGRMAPGRRAGRPAEQAPAQAIPLEPATLPAHPAPAAEPVTLAAHPAMLDESDLA